MAPSRKSHVDAIFCRDAGRGCANNGGVAARLSDIIGRQIEAGQD
jgi:hypothetical protein